MSLSIQQIHSGSYLSHKHTTLTHVCLGETNTGVESMNTKLNTHCQVILCSQTLHGQLAAEFCTPYFEQHFETTLPLQLKFA